MEKRALPLAAMEKILKRAGAPRVGEDAKAAMREALEEHANSVAARALEYSKHAGRRTIKAEDVRLALK